eukprot:3811440-Pyramimonas_sp.AAC.1
MDLSLTKYADDLTKLHVGGGPGSPLQDAGLAELSSVNEFSNARLDEHLCTGGWEHNVMKQNTIISLTGKGSVDANRRLRKDGGALFSGGVRPATR